MMTDFALWEVVGEKKNGDFDLNSTPGWRNWQTR
jgi:hypothetical protein